MRDTVMLHLTRCASPTAELIESPFESDPNLVSVHVKKIPHKMVTADWTTAEENDKVSHFQMISMSFIVFLMTFIDSR